MSSGQNGRSALGNGATEQVIIALRRIVRAIDLHSRVLVNRYGLTGPQLAVLKQLSRQGGLTMSALARAVHLSLATVAGILARLEKRNLVRRSRSEQDKRRVLVWLTRAGVDILSQAPPPLTEAFTAEFGKLADWEQTQILSSLQRIVSMMEARDLDAAPLLTTGPIDATPERAQAFLGKEPASAEPDIPSASMPDPPGTGDGQGPEQEGTTAKKKGGGDASPGNKTMLVGPNHTDPV